MWCAKLRLAGIYRACRKTIGLFRRPVGIPDGSARLGEIRGYFGGGKASVAVPYGPLWRIHILTAALAVRSTIKGYLEKETPRPTALGQAGVCKTVRFPDRLRKKPVGKPDGY